MKSNELRGLLRSIGAKESEIRVYVVLRTSKEPLPVSSIVNKTKLSEKTVRNALKALMERGLVVRVGRGRGTRYRAFGTRKLLSLVRKRIEEGINELFTRLRFRSL